MPGRHVDKLFRPRSSYHVYNRGADERNVFLDDRDRATFLRLVIDALAREPSVTALAFAVMTSHYHLLLHQGSDELAVSRTMHRVALAYVRHFNHTYREHGPLWDGRYRARLVTGRADLINLATYIHLNPRDERHRESWTSHSHYLGKVSEPWLDPTRCLRAFGGHAGYERFFADTARVRAARRAAERRLWE